jgi:DNA-binding CsgD family transcriptional regulator
MCMTVERTARPLIGRAAERDTLRRLVSDPASGEQHVLVVRGEAGVGKTALLDDVAAHAEAGFQITRVAGIESDIGLTFAGLQHLCLPLLGFLDTLPELQRNAIEVAFGRASGPTPDRFLIGLAVLGLLAAAGERRPLLCIIDDAQWLDQMSLQTLSFVARRLLAERVVLVFAARTGTARLLAGLPELTVTGLSDSDARQLLESVVVGRLDNRVCDRIVAETRGNPLALVEVPHNVSPAELLGGVPVTGHRPSAGHVTEGYVRRIQALPRDTRKLVLAAAAEPVGDTTLLMRTFSELGIPIEALAPAEDSGLLEFGTRLRFRHPLVRSAVYHAADLEDRREVHRALAVAIDADTDPDRRAWHAAHAAAGPDDRVADDLEASAARAQERGGLAAAATFLERAVALTADPALRASRALVAARAKREAAAPHEAYELLAIAESGPLTELQRAEAIRMRGAILFTLGRVGDPAAPPLSTSAAQLLQAAGHFEPLHPQLARDTYFEVFGTAMYTGRSDPTALPRAAGAITAAMAGADLDRPTDRLISALSTHVAGGDASSDIRAALHGWLARHAPQGGQAVQWMAPATPVLQEAAASEIWDDDLYHRLAADTTEHARRSGFLYALPFALEFLAGSQLLAGEFDTAQGLLDEAMTVSQAVGHVPAKYHTLTLLGWRGDPEQALPALHAARAAGLACGEGRLAGVTAYATAVLYNGLGEYALALEAAREGCAYDDVGIVGWSLAELVEAAVRVGDRPAAESAMSRLRDRAATGGTDWGLATVAGAQALLTEDEDAYREAIERFERTRLAVHTARSHLRYGEWLLRTDRKTPARKHLRAAFDAFTGMGAAAFANRARRQLATVGVRAGSTRAGAGDLTAQEAQIADLVRSGLTNQEVGARLFLSPHTVDWHLRKVFIKLGITSRRQLRTRG